MKWQLISPKISMKNKKKKTPQMSVNCFLTFSPKKQQIWYLWGRVRAPVSLTDLIAASDGIIIFTIRPFPRWRAPFVRPDIRGRGDARRARTRPVNVRQVWQAAEMETTDDGCARPPAGGALRFAPWLGCAPHEWHLDECGSLAFGPINNNINSNYCDRLINPLKKKAARRKRRGQIRAPTESLLT